jgi:hypothetical protein
MAEGKFMMADQRAVLNQDAIFLRLAFAQALKSYEEEGLPIGAIMVEGGQVIARGAQSKGQDGDPTPHREMVCLRRAGRRSRYAAVTLYHLEPVHDVFWHDRSVRHPSRRDRREPKFPRMSAPNSCRWLSPVLPE